MSEKVKIELSKEEAIVLFEYLARVNENDALDKTFEHKAEQRVIWNLEATFEKVLAEPFKSDYKKIVDDAKKAIMANIEDDE